MDRAVLLNKVFQVWQDFDQARDDQRTTLSIRYDVLLLFGKRWTVELEDWEMGVILNAWKKAGGKKAARKRFRR